MASQLLFMRFAFPYRHCFAPANSVPTAFSKVRWFRSLFPLESLYPFVRNIIFSSSSALPSSSGSPRFSSYAIVTSVVVYTADSCQLVFYLNFTKNGNISQTAAQTNSIMTGARDFMRYEKKKKMKYVHTYATPNLTYETNKKLKYAG